MSISKGINTFKVTSPLINDVGVRIIYYPDQGDGFFTVSSEYNVITKYIRSLSEFITICGLLGHDDIEFQMEYFSGWDTTINIRQRETVIKYLDSDRFISCEGNENGK